MPKGDEDDVAEDTRRTRRRGANSDNKRVTQLLDLVER